MQIGWRKIHIVALMGFLIRVTVALVSEQIHQADEIFQYLEQAHRLVFGYGYIPWEYRFGIRSWILPGLLSLPLQLCHTLNIDNPNLYVPAIKILCCAASVSLIYAAYLIGRNIASEQVGKIASLLTCFWYELIYFASRPTPEVLAAYLLMMALALATLPTKRSPLLFGFLCAAAGILRFQYLPAIAILLISRLFFWRRKQVMATAIIGLITVGLAGAVDYWVYGSFFASYYNNYLYNSVYKVSNLFGEHPPILYLLTLTSCSIGIFPGAIALSCKQAKSLWPAKSLWLPLSCAAAIVLSHSWIVHKEHRFIFAAIPICLVLTAVVISGSLAQWCQAFPRKARHFLAIAALVLSIFSAALIFPLQKDIYVNTKFGQPSPSILSQQPILKAYLFLHEQEDLAAVLNLFSPWYSTGGYYYLHRNLPVYFPDQFESANVRRLRPYVSHIVCRVGEKEIPGFYAMTQIGEVEIRKQTRPPKRYRRLNIDTMNVLQSGIDDKYTPTVRPRF